MTAPTAASATTAPNGAAPNGAAPNGVAPDGSAPAATSAGAPMSRRAFLGRAAVLGAGVLIVPRHVLGGPGYVAPSDVVHVAMIGGGGMGASNAYALVAGGQRIVAIADVDQARADQGAAERAAPNARTGQADPVGAQMVEQYQRAARHADFRRLLERERGIDAVVIAAPDHVHAAAAVAAMQLGKHVYVQKPLTYSVHEARALRALAARLPKVVTQMGNQGHSSREAALINQWVRAGAIGPVREVHVWTNRPIWPQGVPAPAPLPAQPAGAAFGNAYNARALAEQLAAAMAAQARATGAHTPPASLDWDLYCGPAPLVDYHPIYHPFNWRGFTAFGVGAIGDMGAHLIDHPFWALELGLPTSVEATSTPWGGPSAAPVSYPIAMTAHYEFAARPAAGGVERPAVRLSWYDGGLMPERPPQLPDAVALPRDGGVIMIGDRGILTHETYGGNPRIWPEARFREVAPEYVGELEARQREVQAAERAGTPVPPRRRPPTLSHEMEWIEAIRAGRQANAPFEYAAPLTETMLLGIVALRAGQGRKILYDAANMRVTNAPEADQWLRREYRAGWSL